MSYTEYNLEIWGQNAMSNILYITGLPGSGKSSLAYDFAEEDDAYIIHLDYYTDDNAPANKVFDSYLDSNYPGWYNVREDYINGNDVSGTWFTLLENAIVSFGVHSDHPVIVEGVQLMDDTLFSDNKEYFQHQPFILMDMPTNRRKGISKKQWEIWEEAYYKLTEILNES